jgi:hypothetical protein
MSSVPSVPQQRNLTPPEIARRYRVGTKKVISWIATGELAALNLASSSSTRPRYSVTPEALEEFEVARRVIPEAGPVRRRRRRLPSGVKQFV